MMTQPQGDPKRGKNWSSDEDEQLCRSWLVASKDPIKGTDQHKGDFWKSIKTHAEVAMSSFANRPHDGLRQRFAIISHHVSKFIGHLAFVNRLNRSGTTAEDRTQEARQLFLKEMNLKAFKIQGCYDILKGEPKFRQLEDMRRLIKKKALSTNVSDISCSSNTTSEETPGSIDTSDATISSNAAPRPIGQKKAKMLKQQGSSQQAVCDEFVFEMKRKNDILERFTIAMENATRLRIITATSEGLDEPSRLLLEQEKKQLLE